MCCGPGERGGSPAHTLPKGLRPDLPRSSVQWQLPKPQVARRSLCSGRSRCPWLSLPPQQPGGRRPLSQDPPLQIKMHVQLKIW